MTWRLEAVKTLAAFLAPVFFGVNGFYLIGSTKNAVAGPASDIDIIIHFSGNKKQLIQLKKWLNSWSLKLSSINDKKTGYKTEGLLDIHIINDEDIKKQTSFAIKIGAVTDAAKSIPMGIALDQFTGTFM